MPSRLLALLPLSLPLPLILAACAPAAPAGQTARDQAAIAAAPQARVLGPGVTCIDRSAVRASVVRSSRVIDFEMNGGKVYRNTLKANCPGLGSDRAITYETSIDQLCTPQIVYSLTNFGGVPQRGAACSLGEFVPVEYEKRGER